MSCILEESNVTRKINVLEEIYNKVKDKDDFAKTSQRCANMFEEGVC
jgi:hypothetical protein